MKKATLILAGIVIAALSGRAQTPPKMHNPWPIPATGGVQRGEAKLFQIQTRVNLSNFQRQHLETLLLEGNWMVDNVLCQSAGCQGTGDHFCQGALCNSNLLLFALLDNKQQIQYLFNTSAPISRR